MCEIAYTVGYGTADAVKRAQVPQEDYADELADFLKEDGMALLFFVCAGTMTMTFLPLMDRIYGPQY